MDTLKQILARSAKRHKRHGGLAWVEAQLPRAKPRAAVRRIPDDRLLAEMARAVFQAGFVWRVIEAKWEGFEDAFQAFDPAWVAGLSEFELNALANDQRIVRNPQKIGATRDNAVLLVDIASEHGSAARFFASWPTTDMVGLWDLLKRRGSRLGGMTGPLFLRRIGVDTPMLSADVVQALREQDVINTRSPTSKKALSAVQTAFNTWHDESGRSLAEISRIVSMSTGDVHEP